jgi:hypothetical protein
VVVDLRHRLLDVLVGEARLNLDDASVERGEDWNADAFLAERTDQRVLAAVAVVGLRAAAPVEDAGAWIEVDEVAEVEVLPRDPGLRIEGEDRRLAYAGRARRDEGE